MTSGLGSVFIFAFIALSAVRDVFYGAAFQHVSFFLLIALSFSLTVLFFLLAALKFRRQQLFMLIVQWRILLGLNITTALAWFSYFFAIKWMEPSVVNTIWSGLGPIFIMIFASIGFGSREEINKKDYFFQAGILGTLVYLCWIQLTGRSAFSGGGLGQDVLAIAVTSLSAFCIIISVLLSKKLNEKGIGASSIVALRFVVLAVIAIVLTWGEGVYLPALSLLSLSVWAFVLIVLPIYFFQIGLQKGSTFTVEAITAFGPALVFFVQILDKRLTYSNHTLIAIALYTLFSLGAIGARFFVTDGRLKTGKST